MVRYWFYMAVQRAANEFPYERNLDDLNMMLFSVLSYMIF